MTTECEIAIHERFKYVSRRRVRSAKADRQERGRLLDGMEAVWGMHRKSLRRRLNSSLDR